MTEKLWQVFLSLFYSTPCFVCESHTALSEKTGVCLDCLRKRKLLERKKRKQPICPICCQVHSIELDPLCTTRNIFFESLDTVQFRTDREKSLFQICKFKKQKVLGRYFAIQTTGTPFSKWERPDQIILIPSEDKKNGRMFHPAGFLAERLARKWKIPLLKNIRKISKEKQSSKGFQERFLHSKKAWSILGSNKNTLGSEILLIDDVMTTGASLNEIAKRLQLMGVLKVRCLVLLRSEERVDGDSDQEGNKNHSIQRSYLEGRF